MGDAFAVDGAHGVEAVGETADIGGGSLVGACGDDSAFHVFNGYDIGVEGAFSGWECHATAVALEHFHIFRNGEGCLLRVALQRLALVSVAVHSGYCEVAAIGGLAQGELGLCEACGHQVAWVADVNG